MNEKKQMPGNKTNYHKILEKPPCLHQISLQMQNTNVSMGDNLFNDMQKVMEDEYDINCKAFEQELKN